MAEFKVACREAIDRLATGGPSSFVEKMPHDGSWPEVGGGGGGGVKVSEHFAKDGAKVVLKRGGHSGDLKRTCERRKRIAAG